MEEEPLPEAGSSKQDQEPKSNPPPVPDGQDLKTESNWVEKWKNKILKNKVAAAIVFIVLTFIGIGDFLGAFDNVVALVNKKKNAPIEPDVIIGVIKRNTLKDPRKRNLPLDFNVQNNKDAVSLQFVASFLKEPKTFKAIKTWTTGELCTKLVNHFDIDKTININGEAEVVRTLRINDIDITDQNKTLEQLNVHDKDVVQVIYLAQVKASMLAEHKYHVIDNVVLGFQPKTILHLTDKDSITIYYENGYEIKRQYGMVLKVKNPFYKSDTSFSKVNWEKFLTESDLYPTKQLFRTSDGKNEILKTWTNVYKSIDLNIPEKAEADTSQVKKF